MSGKGNVAGFLYLQLYVNLYLFIYIYIVPPLGACDNVGMYSLALTVVGVVCNCVLAPATPIRCVYF